MATFAQYGIVKESTVFGENLFTYSLKAKKGISELKADYSRNTITIYFPEKNQKVWAINSIVGYSNSIASNENRALSLLVEKDFTCLDNTIED